MELFLSFFLKSEDYSFFYESHWIHNLICDELRSEFVDPVSELTQISELPSEEVNCLFAEKVIFFCVFIHLKSID